MTTGEIMAMASVFGSILTMLGITGIDAGMISQAITAVISLVTIGTTIWTLVAHRKAVTAASTTTAAQQ